MEIWKDIKNFEGLYQVSNTGKVKSLDRLVAQLDRRVGKEVIMSYKGKILKPKVDKYGRCHIVLSSNGNTITRRIHQLVAEAFLSYTQIGSNKNIVVDHIDNNPSNNNLTNLQLITQRANVSRAKSRNTNGLPTGVGIRNGLKPYVAQIKINNKSVYLGSFLTVNEAGIAYENALLGLVKNLNKQ